MRARIYVTPRKQVLDPQGKAVESSLHSLGFGNVRDVHVGKYVILELDADSRGAAERQVRQMCEKLLTNPVMEDYTFEIEE